MSAEAAALTRSWPVGSRVCTLTVPKSKPGAVMAACIEWEPGPPPHLSASEWREYRAGRNAAIADLAAKLGINAAVIDL